jgi:hypothetical protein
MSRTRLQLRLRSSHRQLLFHRRTVSEIWVDKVNGKKARFQCWDNPSSASTSLGSIRLFSRAMFKTIVPVLSVLFFSLLPVRAPWQCNDQLCRNLQAILDEAVTDFRGYRASQAPGPDVSIEGTAVPCQMSLWANNVPMYICYAKVPNPDSQKWYARTLQVLQGLNPTWHFQISSSGEDHYVDAGPPDCEIPPNDGPRRGQCPLHLQTVKQSDGTSKLHLWMNSLSSTYLLKPPPPPPTKTVSPTAAPATTAGCDDFCQNLKKVFEARVGAFAGIRTAKGNDGTTEVTVRLAGAKQCSVKEALRSQSNGLGTQFVCYWRETSGSAANARFSDLVSRLQILIPSNWSTHQENELDDSTGAEIRAWYAIEPGSKHDVRVYVSVESVGLHVTAWN